MSICSIEKRIIRERSYEIIESISIEFLMNFRLTRNGFSLKLFVSKGFKIKILVILCIAAAPWKLGDISRNDNRSDLMVG